MPKKDGLRVVEELMSGGPPKPRIIVITTYEDEEDLRQAMKAGARGYLVKVADGEQIEEAVRAVAAGRSVFRRHHSEGYLRPESVLITEHLSVIQCPKFKIRPFDFAVLRVQRWQVRLMCVLRSN